MRQGRDNMDLIDRYLHAVGQLLPGKDQDDILRELADDIRSQVDERERERGRPLEQAEIEAVLKQYGHPILLAARYRPRRQLIGPAVFPFYAFVLKWAVGITLIVHVALAIAFALGGRDTNEIIRQLVHFPLAAVTVFGWVTLVFATAEAGAAKFCKRGNWDPRSLPAVPGPRPGRSRVNLAFEAVGSALFVAWWLALPRFPHLVFGPAASFIAPAPIWAAMYVPILLLGITRLIVNVISVIRPDWATFRFAARLAADAVSLVIIVILLNTGTFVIWTGGAGVTQGHTAVVDWTNVGIRVGLLVAGIVTVMESIKEILGCRVRSSRRHLASGI